MINFWVIPILALVAGCLIGIGAIEYKVNTVWPNAAIEREEMKSIDCPEIMKKASVNDFWSPQNGKIGRGMSDVCIDQLKSTSGDPYVDFCTPGGYAPDKKIGNATHVFDHVTCDWNEKN